jgi:hypothetical protein
MVKSWSKEKHTELTKKLFAAHHVQEAEAFGVSFIRESGEHEAFKGMKVINTAAEKIPFAKGVIDKTIGGSERAYTYYQNAAMADMWRYGKEFLKGQKDWNQQSAAELAEFVNDACSRTKIQNRTLKNIGTATFFSPQMIKSRLKTLGDPLALRYNTKAGSFARQQHARAAMMGLATLMGLYTAAKAAGKDPSIEWDPRSSDFGKVRFGSTSYDPWGGYQQYVRFAAQVLSGQYKKVSSGKVQKENRIDIIERFLRSKLAPAPGMLWSELEGRDITGQSVRGTRGGARMVLNAASPMTLRDLKDLYQEDPGMAVVLAVPVLLGASVSSGPFGQKENYITSSGLRQQDSRVGAELRRLQLEPPKLGSRVGLPQRNALHQKLYYTLKPEEYENLQKEGMPEVLDSLDKFISSDRYKRMTEAQKRMSLYKMVTSLNRAKGANRTKKKEILERFAKGDLEAVNDWWK